MYKSFYTFIVTAIFSTLLSSQNAGDLDLTFNQSGIVEFSVTGRKTISYDMSLLSDGKILVTGYALDAIHQYYPYAYVARFHSDGTLDTSFGVNGFFMSETISPNSPSVGGKMIILPDDKILLVADGAFMNTYVFYRLLPDGTIDNTFNTNGYRVEDVPFWNPSPINAELLSDGRLMVYSEFSSSLTGTLVSRFMPNGAIDTSFADNGHFVIYSNNKHNLCRDGVVLPDGKILIPYSSGSMPSDAVWHVKRLLPNGQLDETFGTNGTINYDVGGLMSEVANKITLLPDGSFIVSGYGQKFPGYHFTMVRFLANGNVDNSFGFIGKAQITFDCCFSGIYDVGIQADGKIVACGFHSTSEFEQDRNFAIARFNPNGSVDQSFGTNGKVSINFNLDFDTNEAQTLQIQPDNKILVSGFSRKDGKANTGLIVRLEAGSVVHTTTPQQTDYALKASPNPIEGSQIQVEYTLPEAMPASIYLTDLFGRRISQTEIGMLRQSGRNLEQIVVPESLAPGIYMIFIETPSNTQSLKLVKTSG